MADCEHQNYLAEQDKIKREERARQLQMEREERANQAREDLFSSSSKIECNNNSL